MSERRRIHECFVEGRRLIEGIHDWEGVRDYGRRDPGPSRLRRCRRVDATDLRQGGLNVTVQRILVALQNTDRLVDGLRLRGLARFYERLFGALDQQIAAMRVGPG